MAESVTSPSNVKGVLRKALSGHLGLHRVTTIQKVFKQNELKRGEIVKDKYTKIAIKFKMLEHSVTLEDNAGDEDNENKRVETTIYRTAFQSIVTLMIYFGIGLIALYFIDGEMSYFDIFYFLVITLTTVGYGDVAPSNKFSKLFVCIYTISGLLLFSTAVSGILRYWSQQQEAHYRKQVLDRLSEEEDDMDEDDDMEEQEEDDDKDSEDGEEGKIHIDDSNLGPGSGVGVDDMAGAKSADSPVSPPDTDDHHSLHVPLMIYDMTDNMSKYFVEKLRIPPFAVPIIKDLLKSIFHILLNIAFGTICFYLLQEDDDANIIDCLYLSITTITTVGYGDVVPSTRGAKYFTIFYACVGTLFTAKCIMKFNQAITNYQKQHRQDIILQSEFSLKAFFDMDSDGDNEVTKEEFLLYKILHMNLVDAEIVARIERQFNAWDVDNSGTLTTSDIEIMSSRNNQAKLARPNLINMTRGRGGSGSSNSLMDGFGGGEAGSSRRRMIKSYSMGDVPDSPSQRPLRYSPSASHDKSMKIHPLSEEGGDDCSNIAMIKKSVGFSDVSVNDNESTVTMFNENNS